MQGNSLKHAAAVVDVLAIAMWTSALASFSITGLIPVFVAPHVLLILK